MDPELYLVVLIIVVVAVAFEGLARLSRPGDIAAMRDLLDREKLTYVSHRTVRKPWRNLLVNRTPTSNFARNLIVRVIDSDGRPGRLELLIDPWLTTMHEPRVVAYNRKNP